MTATEHHAATQQAERSDLAAFLSDLGPLLGDLDRLWAVTGGDPLKGIAGYALLPAGKVLRPLLVLTSARCVGAERRDLGELALAIEYLHVATLIHDDIIDGDDVRRGRPSVHAAFGVPDAIVGGDGLILQTFATLTGTRPAGVTDAGIIEVVHVLATAGLRLCRGQLQEAELAGNLGCTVEQYLDMARLKTGVLFEAACRIGAVLGGGRREWVEALGSFGSHLGAAFQIRDDLLAFDDGAAPIGKPPESDVQNRRPTLPMLLAYQRAGDRDRDILQQAFRAESADADAYPRVRRIVRTTGAQQEAGEYATEMITRAKRCLTTLPAGEGSSALGALADYACGRRF